jgi:hypothetical protein
MKYLKLDETLSLNKAVSIRCALSTSGCKGCFFQGIGSGIGQKDCKDKKCISTERKDNQSVIFIKQLIIKV